MGQDSLAPKKPDPFDRFIVKRANYSIHASLGLVVVGDVMEQVSPENQSKILTAARTYWIEQDVMLHPDYARELADRGVFNGEANCNGCDDPFPEGQNLGVADLEPIRKLIDLGEK